MLKEIDDPFPLPPENDLCFRAPAPTIAIPESSRVQRERGDEKDLLYGH